MLYTIHQRDCLLHLVSVKYFSLLSSFISSSSLTWQPVVFWPSASLLFPCLPTANPVLPYTDFLSSYTRSFTAALTCLSEKQGTHSCTRRWPSQSGGGWQAKEFLLQHNWVLHWSPSALFAISDLSQYWFSSISIKETGNKLFSQFPPRFLICWFLFHILIWPWILIPIV